MQMRCANGNCLKKITNAEETWVDADLLKNPFFEGRKILILFCRSCSQTPDKFALQLNTVCKPKAELKKHNKAG